MAVMSRLFRRRRARLAFEADAFADLRSTPNVRILDGKPPVTFAEFDDEPARDGPWWADDRSVAGEPSAIEDDGGVVLELRRPVDLEPAADDGEPMGPAEALERAGARNLPARSIERMLFEVALRNEIVAQRVERIERRLDDIANEVFEAATQCDLIEVEARRARLAAEVTRLSVELRAEIDGGLQRLAREMATLVAARGEVDAAPRPAPCPVALSQLADLDTMPADLLDPPGHFAATAG